MRETETMMNQQIESMDSKDCTELTNELLSAYVSKGSNSLAYLTKCVMKATTEEAQDIDPKFLLIFFEKGYTGLVEKMIKKGVPLHPSSAAGHIFFKSLANPQLTSLLDIMFRHAEIQNLVCPFFRIISPQVCYHYPATVVPIIAEHCDRISPSSLLKCALASQSTQYAVQFLEENSRLDEELIEDCHEWKNIFLDYGKDDAISAFFDLMWNLENFSFTGSLSRYVLPASARVVLLPNLDNFSFYTVIQLIRLANTSETIIQKAFLSGNTFHSMIAFEIRRGFDMNRIRILDSSWKELGAAAMGDIELLKQSLFHPKWVTLVAAHFCQKDLVLGLLSIYETKVKHSDVKLTLSNVLTSNPQCWETLNAVAREESTNLVQYVYPRQVKWPDRGWLDPYVTYIIQANMYLPLTVFKDAMNAVNIDEWIQLLDAAIKNQNIEYMEYMLNHIPSEFKTPDIFPSVLKKLSFGFQIPTLIKFLQQYEPSDLSWTLQVLEWIVSPEFVFRQQVLNTSHFRDLFGRTMIQRWLSTKTVSELESNPHFDQWKSWIE
jgi:hypothetical protein